MAKQNNKPYVSYDPTSDCLFISLGLGKPHYTDIDLTPPEWRLINWYRKADTDEIAGVEVIGLKRMIKELEKKKEAK